MLILKIKYASVYSQDQKARNSLYIKTILSHLVSLSYTNLIIKIDSKIQSLLSEHKSFKIILHKAKKGYVYDACLRSNETFLISLLNFISHTYRFACIIPVVLTSYRHILNKNWICILTEKSSISMVTYTQVEHAIFNHSEILYVYL